jgi:hypothetical protein
MSGARPRISDGDRGGGLMHPELVSREGLSADPTELDSLVDDGGDSNATE